MKKKVLIVATVASMIDQFNKNNINILQKLGYEVHVATNFSKPGTITNQKSADLINELKSKNVKCIQIDFARSPFDIKSNILSYKQLKELITINKDYDLIHLHSPVGAAIGRLAINKNSKIKVVYTAHGFHFYKGSSIKNWLIYYPVEKILARKTDVLITINEEDYQLASCKKLGKKIELVPGIGVDPQKFYPRLDNKKNELKLRLGFDENKIILTYIGELSKRKNQEFLINAIKDYQKKEKIQLVLVGLGRLEQDLKKIVEKNKLKNNVLFLGYRKDIADVLGATDILISTSYQEGLPVNILEGMFSGKPILVSDCRGNRDLIIDGINGYVYDIDNTEEFLKKLDLLVVSENKRKKFAEKNTQLSIKYSKNEVSKIMERIYKLGE